MKRRQELILFVLDTSVRTFDVLGDIIVFVWLLQAVFGFDYHPSYWFTGVYTWYGAFGFWMLAWLIHTFEKHYQRKYKE